MRNRLSRIITGSILFLAALIIKTDIMGLRLAIYIAAYLVVGGDVIYGAVRNILKGEIFDENFLMGIASIGAFFIGEYPEGVAVMLFYQVGELFQSYAVDKSERSIAELMDLRPDFANLKQGDDIIKVAPDKVNIGDTIIVKAGEKVPLDGMVIEGSSMVDTSSLTGESVPREMTIGSQVLSGCININGLLTVEVTKAYNESTVSKILDLVQNAVEKKSKPEQFITKFSRYYTPIIVYAALAIALVPPLVTGWSTFEQWLYRALTFLVVSCPCALVLSVPLSFFGGIGRASGVGILIKGSNYIEALAKTETIVFDKTGTLTKGVFDVQEIYSEGISKENLLELAAYAENYSNHPISASIKRAFGKDIDQKRISDVEEIPGLGINAIIDGKNIRVGNSRLMDKMNIPFRKNEVLGTVAHVAIDNKYVGYIVIADEIKSDSAKAIKGIRDRGIKEIVMLTGDSNEVGSKVAKELGIDKVYSELLPAGKVEKLEELMAEKNHKGKLAFVGDGINDAPVLARADLGIAMGGLGTDAAIEAADIVIMTDEPSKIVTALNISRKTINIANQNILFAIGVKMLVLMLSAAGLANMWAAVFADVGVTILVVLNSFRALRMKI